MNHTIKSKSSCLRHHKHIEWFNPATCENMRTLIQNRMYMQIIKLNNINIIKWSWNNLRITFPRAINKDRQKNYFLCLLLNPQSNTSGKHTNWFYTEFLLLPPPPPLSPFPSPSLFLAEVLALVLAGRCFGAPLEAFLQVVFPAVVMVDALRAHSTVKQYHFVSAFTIEWWCYRPV